MYAGYQNSRFLYICGRKITPVYNLFNSGTQPVSREIYGKFEKQETTDP